MNFFALISGIGSLAFAIYQLFRMMPLIYRGLRTTGTVIEERSRGGPGNKLFIYTVHFNTEDGGDIVFDNYTLFTHQVGSIVNIRYNLKNPRHAKIDSWSSLWGFTVLYGLIGIFFTIIGLRGC